MSISDTQGKRIHTREIPKLTAKEEHRFLRNYEAPQSQSDCWEWKGRKQSRGYGMFSLRGSQYLSHRISYSHFVGSIPDGHVIDHLCGNRSCINPNHLDVATSRENTLRGGGPTAINARMTTCHQGHPLEGDNLQIKMHSDGLPRRVCIACKRNKEIEMWRADGPPHFSVRQAQWLKDNHGINVPQSEEGSPA